MRFKSTVPSASLDARVSHMANAEEMNLYSDVSEESLNVHSIPGRKCVPESRRTSPPLLYAYSGFTLDSFQGTTNSKECCPLSTTKSSDPGTYLFPVACANPTATKPAKTLVGVAHTTFEVVLAAESLFATISPNRHPIGGNAFAYPLPYNDTTVDAYTAPVSGHTCSNVSVVAVV